MKLVFLGVLGGVIVVGFLVCSRRKHVAKRELDELLNGDDICRYAVPLLGPLCASLLSCWVVGCYCVVAPRTGSDNIFSGDGV